MNQGPRTLSYNPAENMVLITYEAETGGTYELYSVPKDASRAADSAVGCLISRSHLHACLHRLFADCTEAAAQERAFPAQGTSDLVVCYSSALTALACWPRRLPPSKLPTRTPFWAAGCCHACATLAPCLWQWHQSPVPDPCLPDRRSQALHPVTSSPRPQSATLACLIGAAKDFTT